MSVLKQNITRKGQLDKLTSQLWFDDANGKGNEYKVEEIWDNMVYARDSEDYILGIYYLVS